MADSAALWLPVMPSLRDFGPSLVKGVAKEAEKGGKLSGVRFGKAFGIAAAGIAGVTAAGTALYSVGKQFDDMTNTIRVGTGASGADLDRFVQNAKNVGAQVPHEFDAIGDTIADVNTQMHLTGDDLETVSSQFLEAGRILDEEIDVATVGKSFQAFGIETEDMSETLDYLFQVSQDTGVGMNELADKARSAAPAADALGFSFEETANMVGVFDNAGLNAGNMISRMSRRMGDLAEEGEEPRDTFNRVVGEIDEMIESGDRFAAQDLAKTAFGTRNAEQFIKAIEDGTLSLEELGEIGELSGDTILGLGEETMQLSDHWQVFKNEALIALEPVATRVFEGMTDLVSGLGDRLRDDIIPAFESFVGWVQDSAHWLGPLVGILSGAAGAIIAVNAAMTAWTAVTRAWSTVTTVATAIQKGFNAVMRANPIGLVITALTALIGGLVWFFTQTETGQKMWETFTDALATAWEWVTETVGAGVSWLWENALEPFFNWVTDAWGAVSEWFSNQYESWIGPTLDALGDAALWVWEEALQPFIGWLGDAWANLTEWFSGAYESWISPVFDAFGTVATWLWENILEPVFGFIGSHWGLILEGMRLYWEHVLSPVFSAISTVAVWLWEEVLEPVFSWIGDHWHLIVDGMVWYWENALKPAWDLLAAVATWLWEHVLEPVFSWIGEHWDDIIAGIVWAWENRLKPTWDTLVAVAQWLYHDVLSPIFAWIGDRWDSMSTRLRSIYDSYIQPVFDAFVDAIEWIEDTFDTVVDAVEKTWDKIREVAAKPIKFVIDDVINNGLIEAYNWLIDKLPFGSTIDTISMPQSLQGFADGGHTGPGDKHDPAGIVHAGEYVLRKESTSRLLRTVGMAGLDYINRTGQLPIGGFAGGGIVRPISGQVTSGFGASRGRYPHAGIDFAAPVGTPVYAAMDGTVSRAGTNIITGRTGLGMFLDHVGGRNTYYGHLSQFIASVGDAVKQGQQIALSGNTGNTTGPHLHFETWTGGSAVDPAPYLSGASLPAGAEGTRGDDYSWLLKPLVDFGDAVEGWVLDEFPDGIMPPLGVGTVKDVYDTMLDWAQVVIDDMSSFFGGSKSTRGVKAEVQEMAASRGWHTGAQWDALEALVQRESSWDPDAANPNSTARGLFQKMTSIHGPIEDTVAGQAAWGLNYIGATYGSPTNALAFHDNHNYYDAGGYVIEPDHTLLRDDGGRVPPGWNAILNNTGRDELMLNYQDAIRTAELLRGNGGNGTHIHGDVYTQDAEQFADYVETRRRRADKHVVV